jgi:hypothetical protein
VYFYELLSDVLNHIQKGPQAVENIVSQNKFEGNRCECKTKLVTMHELLFLGRSAALKTGMDDGDS